MAKLREVHQTMLEAQLQRLEGALIVISSVFGVSRWGVVRIESKTGSGSLPPFFCELRQPRQERSQEELPAFCVSLYSTSDLRPALLAAVSVVLCHLIIRELLGTR